MLPFEKPELARSLTPPCPSHRRPTSTSPTAHLQRQPTTPTTGPRPKKGYQGPDNQIYTKLLPIPKYASFNGETVLMYNQSTGGRPEVYTKHLYTPNNHWTICLCRLPRRLPPTPPRFIHQTWRGRMPRILITQVLTTSDPNLPPKELCQ